MPLVLTRPFVSAPAVLNFVKTLSGFSNEEFRDVTTDSSGNVFVTARTNTVGAGSNDMLIAKYDNTGVLQWQRALGGAGSETGEGITTDSTGNVYSVGATYSTGGGNGDVLLAKYNTSGGIQWQRTLGLAQFEYGFAADMDSSNNLYFAGQGTPITQTHFLIGKYDSAGVPQWNRTLANGAFGVDGKGIAVSGSSVYAIGDTNNQVFVVKYNTAGAIQWQRTLTGGGSDRAEQIAVDSLGDCYLVGNTNSGGAGLNDAFIAKYDSTGAFQWQRFMGGTGDESFTGVAVDSSNDVYVVGTTDSQGAGADDILVAKYDSTGAIQWQRTMGSTSADLGRSVAVDNSGNVIIVGETAVGPGSTSGFVASLPDDGAGLGVYTSFTYQASTLTEQAGSLVSATSAFVDAAGGLSNATSVLTDQAVALTDTSY